MFQAFQTILPLEFNAKITPIILWHSYHDVHFNILSVQHEAEKNKTKYTVRDSVKGFYACILKMLRSGQVTPIPDTQTTEYNATQLV